jgi:hypothetical protein
MTRYIHHVTLQSGHVARQYRKDVSDAAINAMSALLDSILTGGRPAVPGYPDFWVDGAHEGRVLVVTLWTGMRDEGIPILTSATCIKSRASPAAWRALHESAVIPYRTDPNDYPPAPWTADRLEVGYLPMAEAAMQRGENALWTGHFARCIAWAWMEYDQ